MGVVRSLEFFLHPTEGLFFWCLFNCISRQPFRYSRLRLPRNLARNRKVTRRREQTFATKEKRVIETNNRPNEEHETVTLHFDFWNIVH